MVSGISFFIFKMGCQGCLAGYSVKLPTLDLAQVMILGLGTNVLRESIITTSMLQYFAAGKALTNH